MEKTTLSVLEPGKISVFNAPFESDNLLVRKGVDSLGSFFKNIFYVYIKTEKKDESLNDIDEAEINHNLNIILKFISIKNLLKICNNEFCLDDNKTASILWKTVAKQYLHSLVNFLKHLYDDTEFDMKLVMYVSDEEKRNKFKTIMDLVSLKEIGKIVSDFVENKRGLGFEEYLDDRLSNLLERQLMNVATSKKEHIRDIFLKLHKKIYEGALKEQLQKYFLTNMNLLETGLDIKKMICAYINFNVVVISAETRSCHSNIDIGSEKTIILLQFSNNGEKEEANHYELVGTLESGNNIKWFFDSTEECVSYAKIR